LQLFPRPTASEDFFDSRSYEYLITRISFRGQLPERSNCRESKEKSQPLHVRWRRLARFVNLPSGSIEWASIAAVCHSCWRPWASK
jgi:hypothetical protein